MKQFYLIRHAQSESNAGLIVRENPKINITDLGKQQAEQLADWLIDNITQPINKVLLSPYVRTQQTAEPYLQRAPHATDIIHDLHEINLLEFEQIKSLNFTQIADLAKDFWQKPRDYKASDNADSFDEFAQRVRAARRYFESLDDGCYLVFTHGMWIGMLIWQLLHCDHISPDDKQRFHAYEPNIRPNNCDVYLLTIDAKNRQSITKLRHTVGEDVRHQTM